MRNTVLRILRQILGVTIATCVLLLGIECVLMVCGASPPSPVTELQLNVAGELLGEHDPYLFWRLKDVQPEYSDGARRIMVLTDSVSVMYEGRGYPDLLQTRLTQLYPEERLEVFNGGVPGYTSFQGLRYLQSELLDYRPELVVICYGWNDHWASNNGLPDKEQLTAGGSLLARLSFLRSVRLVTSLARQRQQQHYDKRGEVLRVGPVDYRRNLGQMIELCTNRGIRVVLMTAPYYRLNETVLQRHQHYNQTVRDLADQYGVVLYDPVALFVGRQELFIEPAEDPVHYNWQGATIVADALAQLLPPLLGLGKVKVRNE